MGHPRVSSSHACKNKKELVTLISIFHLAYPNIVPTCNSPKIIEAFYILFLCTQSSEGGCVLHPQYMSLGTSHISSAPKRHVPSGYCIGRHRFRESCVRSPGDSLTVPTKGQVAYAQAERARLFAGSTRFIHPPRTERSLNVWDCTQHLTPGFGEPHGLQGVGWATCPSPALPQHLVVVLLFLSPLPCCD